MGTTVIGVLVALGGLVIGWLKYSFGKVKAENKYFLKRSEQYRDELKAVKKVLRKAKHEEIDNIPRSELVDALNVVLQKRSRKG